MFIPQIEILKHVTQSVEHGAIVGALVGVRGHDSRYFMNKCFPVGRSHELKKR